MKPPPEFYCWYRASRLHQVPCVSTPLPPEERCFVVLTVGGSLRTFLEPVQDQPEVT